MRPPRKTGGQYTSNWRRCQIEAQRPQVEMGEGAAESTGVSLGDRITAEVIIPCRTCWFCQRGLYHLCDRHGVCVGAWAEFLRIPCGAIVHRVPAHLPAEEAALIEPLSCSIHGVQLADIGLDDAVVIAGLGAIGMGMLQVARLKTPRLLIGLDLDTGLLRIAQELGADHVFNPARDDVGAEIQALTEGRGCDIYIEASGSPRSVQTGLDALRKAGAVGDLRRVWTRGNSGLQPGERVQGIGDRGRPP